MFVALKLKHFTMKTYEYGAMSSRFSLEAENKLTAYTAMIVHFDESSHLVVVYEPQDSDQWFDVTGFISERIDEIFGGKHSFDAYFESHIDEIKACYKTIKRLI
jgi:Na+-transporting NADH:ubiquinone oxidoreductase subunit NqrF